MEGVLVCLVNRLGNLSENIVAQLFIQLGVASYTSVNKLLLMELKKGTKAGRIVVIS